MCVCVWYHRVKKGEFLSIIIHFFLLSGSYLYFIQITSIQFYSVSKKKHFFSTIFLIFLASPCLIILRIMLLRHILIHPMFLFIIFLMIHPAATTCIPQTILVLFWSLRSSLVRITLHGVNPCQLL